MRRVLLADDPQLAPRLEWLRGSLGGAWELVLSPADQVRFWTESGIATGGRAAAYSDADTLIAANEAVDLTIAASAPELLSVASRLAFRPGARIAVLPEAAQTADWIFSLYPLSEGAAPRVQGVLTHRASAAVQAFEDQLPEVVTARHLTVACTLPASALTMAAVEKQFVEDIDLLRSLAGEFKHLMAVEIPADVPRLSRSVAITLGGEGAGSVSWMVMPGSRYVWTLMKQGNDDECKFLMRTAEGGFRFEDSCGNSTASWKGDGLPEPDDGQSSLGPWKDVLRAFDDLAALRRSLKKRRQVELQTEIISEQAQFKSVMSASGCGLLMATLFGAVALLAAGAAFDPRQSQQRTSERAGLVLREDDFRLGAVELTEDASVEWPGMVRRLSQTAAPILIEQTSESSIDQQRRERLVSTLTEAGVPSPASRVEIYEFRGKLFLNLLTGLWVLLFLPLGIFLAVQALLLAAPSSKRVI